MLDCTTDRYDGIYAPWLRKPGDLLRLAEYEPGQRLLDLCGGTGIISRAASLRYSYHPPTDVTLLDLNPRCKARSVRQVKGKAEDVATHFGVSEFDIVICRQAMGYVEPSFVIPGVARVLKPGGRFVFSTFVHPRWGNVKAYSYKHYTYGEKRNHYVEAHLFAFNRILHLQWRLGVGADVTLFRYHPREKLEELLRPWFDFEVHEVGRALRWVCTKPGKLRAVGG